MNQTLPAPKTSKGRLIAYWVLTGYLAFESILSATWDFNWLNKGYAISLMQHLGFPPYFLVIKGIGTLLAAPIFVLPGLRLLKEWAYFGTFIMYAAAIASHLAVGDGFKTLIAPIVFLLISVASWALRREIAFKKLSRKVAPLEPEVSIFMFYNTRLLWSRGGQPIVAPEEHPVYRRIAYVLRLRRCLLFKSDFPGALRPDSRKFKTL